MIILNTWGPNAWRSTDYRWQILPKGKGYEIVDTRSDWKGYATSFWPAVQRLREHTGKDVRTGGGWIENPDKPSGILFHGTSKKQLDRLLKNKKANNLYLADAEEKSWDYAEQQAHRDDAPLALLVLDSAKLSGEWEVDSGSEEEEEFDMGQWTYTGPIPVSAIVKAVYIDDETGEEERLENPKKKSEKHHYSVDMKYDFEWQHVATIRTTSPKDAIAAVKADVKRTGWSIPKGTKWRAVKVEEQKSSKKKKLRRRNPEQDRQQGFHAPRRMWTPQKLRTTIESTGDNASYLKREAEWLDPAVASRYVYGPFLDDWKSEAALILWSAKIAVGNMHKVPELYQQEIQGVYRMIDQYQQKHFPERSRNPQEESHKLKAKLLR